MAVRSIELLALNPVVKKNIKENIRRDQIPDNAYLPGRNTLKHMMHDGLVNALYRIDSKGIVQGRVPSKKGCIGSDFSHKRGVKHILENHQKPLS